MMMVVGIHFFFPQVQSVFPSINVRLLVIPLCLFAVMAWAETDVLNFFFDCNPLECCRKREEWLGKRLEEVSQKNRETVLYKQAKRALKFANEYVEAGKYNVAHEFYNLVEDRLRKLSGPSVLAEQDKVDGKMEEHIKNFNWNEEKKDLFMNYFGKMEEHMKNVSWDEEKKDLELLVSDKLLSAWSHVFEGEDQGDIDMYKYKICVLWMLRLCAFADYGEIVQKSRLKLSEFSKDQLDKIENENDIKGPHDQKGKIDITDIFRKNIFKKGYMTIWSDKVKKYGEELNLFIQSKDLDFFGGEYNVISIFDVCMKHQESIYNHINDYHKCLEQNGIGKQRENGKTYLDQLLELNKIFKKKD